MFLNASLLGVSLLFVFVLLPTLWSSFTFKADDPVACNVIAKADFEDHNAGHNISGTIIFYEKTSGKLEVQLQFFGGLHKDKSNVEYEIEVADEVERAIHNVGHFTINNNPDGQSERSNGQIVLSKQFIVGDAMKDLGICSGEDSVVGMLLTVKRDGIIIAEEDITSEWLGPR
ncbi:9660_t:CDS:1 [Paraglomus brasilianum]|uniref:9660_t:CDS:1 n=1 Tax=Paraglomus brasilianum TaxID=144538 RepID=A0A9N8ZLR6_9GLOM|nr:9660_t:CDS:1 [Paraglomus brasilianum]